MTSQGSGAVWEGPGEKTWLFNKPRGQNGALGPEPAS